MKYHLAILFTGVQFNVMFISSTLGYYIISHSGADLRWLEHPQIDILPVDGTALTAEEHDVLAVVLMERIQVVVLDGTQVCDIASRELLPRCSIGDHEIGMGHK